MRTPTLTLAICALAMAGAGKPALGQANGEPLSSAQAKQVREIVREYIQNNPEAVRRAISQQTYREREGASADFKRDSRETQSREVSAPDSDDEKTQSFNAWEEAPGDPAVGPENADVVVVEYFDYNCPYCQRNHAAVGRLIENHPDIRFVFKEFPVIQPETSRLASAVALAVAEQSMFKYEMLHSALMNADDLSRSEIVRMARDAGADMARVRNHIESGDPEKVIRRNIGAAQSGEVTQTPTFFVNGRKLVGNTPYGDLDKAIDRAREEAD